MTGPPQPSRFPSPAISLAPLAHDRLASRHRGKARLGKSPSSRANILLRTGMTAVLAIGLAFGTITLVDEWRIERLADDAFQSRFLLAPGKIATFGSCSGEWNPRALAACVLRDLRLAQQEASPEGRKRRLDDAMQAATRFHRLTPGSALASAQLGLVESFRPGGRAAALRHLQESYRLAAMQRDAALWRVAFAAHNWAALSSETRQAAFNEAMWLVRLGRSDRDLVMAELAGTPLYLPVALRLPGRHGEALPHPQAL